MQNKNESVYAHVPGSTAIRVFLTIVANRQLRMEQLDIKAAYLNSHLYYLGIGIHDDIKRIPR